MRTRNAVIAVAVSAPLLMWGADFWQQKEPSEWTAKEMTRLLTKSPWAKDAGTNFNPDRMRGMGGGGGMGGPGGGMGRGGGMGGPGGGMGGPGGMGGGGGMGGAGGGMGGGGGMGRGGGMGAPEGGGGGGDESAPKMTVRWASAAPVREAANRSEDPAAKQVAEWSEKYYVITVSGGRRMGMGQRNGGGDWQPDPERMKAMQERMRQATSLQAKGKDAIQPERIEMIQVPDGRVTAFLFPRGTVLSKDDKEVVFETARGPMEIKAKFNLAEMDYKGKLEL